MYRKMTAIILALMGIGWLLQGVGIFVAIPSFMNNDLRWAAAGALLLAIALLIWPPTSDRKKG
jgi:hypothetical protein